MDVEDENDDKRVTRLFDDEAVALLQAAAAALFSDRVCAIIEFTK